MFQLRFDSSAQFEAPFESLQNQGWFWILQDRHEPLPYSGNDSTTSSSQLVTAFALANTMPSI